MNETTPPQFAVAGATAMVVMQLLFGLRYELTLGVVPDVGALTLFTRITYGTPRYQMLDFVRLR